MPLPGCAILSLISGVWYHHPTHGNAAAIGHGHDWGPLWLGVGDGQLAKPGISPAFSRVGDGKGEATLGLAALTRHTFHLHFAQHLTYLHPYPPYYIPCRSIGCKLRRDSLHSRLSWANQRVDLLFFLACLLARTAATWNRWHEAADLVWKSAVADLQRAARRDEGGQKLIFMLRVGLHSYD